MPIISWTSFYLVYALCRRRHQHHHHHHRKPDNRRQRPSMRNCRTLLNLPCPYQRVPCALARTCLGCLLLTSRILPCDSVVAVKSMLGGCALCRCQKNGPGQRLLTVVLLLDLEQQRLHPAMPGVQQDISPRSFGVQGSNDHDQHPDIPTVAVFPTAAGFLTLSLYDHHHD